MIFNNSNFYITLWKENFSSHSMIYVAILPAEVALLSKQGASVLYALLTKLNIFSLFLPLAIWYYVYYTSLYYKWSTIQIVNKESFIFSLIYVTFTRISFDLPKARGGKGLHKLNKVKPYTVNNVESCLNKETSTIKLT